MKPQNASERWRERIVQTPDVLGGKPRIRGRRLSVEFITDMLRGGSAEAEIMRSYRIEREDFEACVRYKASGAKLSRVDSEEEYARIDAEESESERREVERMRKLAAAGARPQFWKTRITRDPNILGGKPIIKGTRLSVEFITNMVGRRDTAESVALSYRVEPEDVEACIQYRAMGKKLSNVKWSDFARALDEYDAEREREEMERLRALVEEWDRRAAE